MSIKLVITDIDGVWTDGGMYYDNEGNELKKFNTSDSAGVLFLNSANISLSIITGEKTTIVERRAQKLNVKYLFMGITNKLKTAQELTKSLGIDLKTETAFIGDDINDIALLKEVYLSAAPANAPEYIKKITTWEMVKKGGEGAFREFVERILISEGLFNDILSKYGL